MQSLLIQCAWGKQVGIEFPVHVFFIFYVCERQDCIDFILFISSAALLRHLKVKTRSPSSFASEVRLLELCLYQLYHARLRCSAGLLCMYQLSQFSRASTFSVSELEAVTTQTNCGSNLLKCFFQIIRHIPATLFWLASETYVYRAIWDHLIDCITWTGPLN